MESPNPSIHGDMFAFTSRLIKVGQAVPLDFFIIHYGPQVGISDRRRRRQSCPADRGLLTAAQIIPNTLESLVGALNRIFGDVTSNHLRFYPRTFEQAELSAGSASPPGGHFDEEPCDPVDSFKIRVYPFIGEFDNEAFYDRFGRVSIQHQTILNPRLHYVLAHELGHSFFAGDCHHYQSMQCLMDCGDYNEITKEEFRAKTSGKICQEHADILRQMVGMVGSR